MDDKFWRDYRLERPGTLGGEIRRNEQQLAQPLPSPAAAPTQPNVTTPRAPRAPYKFKGVDLVVAVTAFLATWLVLWRSSNMGGGSRRDPVSLGNNFRLGIRQRRLVGCRGHALRHLRMPSSFVPPTSWNTWAAW